MEYFKINEVPSTPQLAELIEILLPQKTRTITDVLSGFKIENTQTSITLEAAKN